MFWVTADVGHLSAASCTNETHEGLSVFSDRDGLPQSQCQCFRPRCGARRSGCATPEMFVVSDEETAAIRDAFEQRGELAAAVEFMPVVSWHYRQCEGARTIAGWKP